MANGEPQARKIRLLIQYDGSAFAGWQAQKTGITVQQTIEEALARMTGESCALLGSGRTDAGVHALGQVATFTTSSTIPCEGLVKGLNSLLPREVSILDVSEADPDFHPIASAVAKSYVYIVIRSSIRLPLMEKRAWVLDRELNLDAMARAGGMLEGTHDFTSFKASGSGANTSVRTLFRCEVRENIHGPIPLVHWPCYTFYVAANGFLRYMVRNIVGYLVEIGLGRRKAEETSSVLEARDRSVAGMTAPPHGLYLKRVYYPGDPLPFSTA